jgi:hypothetical protein
MSVINKSMADTELADTNADLKKWTDEKMIRLLLIISILLLSSPAYAAEQAAKAETLEEAKEYSNKAVSAGWEATKSSNEAKFAAETAASKSYE